jgi:hypothetical protein
MARYTISYRFPISGEQIYPLLTELMESCQLQIEFEGNDYLMAKENHDEVPFAKLVNVDMIINLNAATQEQITVDFVVRNEELALHKDNHAFQKFEQIKQVIAKNYQADLL